ncbi:HNH endonuclease [Archaeoglobales archaeon]|nr:MAG: HNH endonuclease [Archaeoglobales archaeon]
MDRETWNKIRRRELWRAGYKCEICGYRGKDLHCHEIWEYDDDRKVQKLVGYKILCERCHLAHHLGFATVSGRLEETVGWISKITGMKEGDVWRLVDKAFEEWEERSKYTWKIDYSYEPLLSNNRIVKKNSEKQRTLDEFV